MFRDTIENLCKKSTQYLYKWVASCRLVLRKYPQQGSQAEGNDKKKTKKKRGRKSARFSGFAPSGSPFPYLEKHCNSWEKEGELRKLVERLGR